VKQDVFKRLVSGSRGLNGDAKVLDYLLLAGLTVFRQSSRT
jgi:hypothetical protein